MVATELITGMEDIVQHIKDLEERNKFLQAHYDKTTSKEHGWANAEFAKKFEAYSIENEELKEEREIMSKVIDGMKQEIKKLEEEKSAMKEALAEKFYKHYDDMGYNKLNIARTVGPDLGRMVDHLIKENKELQEDQLTEENAIQYVYENTDEYDDWVKGSTLYQELQEKNKKLQFDYDTRGDIVKGLKETIDKLKEENKKLEDRAVADYDTRMKENKKQLQKMKELEMKGNARKDIIKNMFECITADPEEVQDGFYIKRDWGHKYIDTWNEIVSQEYKDALKDINEQLEGIEWETDGYQFDLNIVDESEDESEDEDPDCCESCGKSFDLQYTLRHADKELGKKYEEYMGSPEDDGDICQVCIMSD